MAEKVPRQVFLHAASLVARRANNWVFDVVTTVAGDVREEAADRFIAEIDHALEILREAMKDSTHDRA